jgi:catechol 2,3-dioxygenase-like lactoylglutathione lyase family enzyme
VTCSSLLVKEPVLHARIRHITVDSRDPHTLSAFWAAVLGYVEDPENPNEPGDPEALIVDPMGRHPGLLFVPVPEPRSVKNRIHLDLMPERARDVTVDALLSLGAGLVADHRRPDGTGWAVLADPEGNEFCVERSASERGIAPRNESSEDQLFPEGIHTAGEARLLSDMLEWYRAAVVRKVSGVSSLDARTSPVRSGTTVAGLIKHLALVEDTWFHERFAGSGDPEPWASAPWDDDRDWEFHSAVDDAVDDLVTLYEQACDRSRRAAAGHDLDDRAVKSTRDFNLRFAYVHLIDETARHLGHMDILREYLDGSVGE